MEKKNFRFEIQRFKPSGKWYDNVILNLKVRYQKAESGEEYIYMNDVVEAIKEHFYESAFLNWSFVTDHEYGYPILVRFDT